MCGRYARYSAVRRFGELFDTPAGFELAASYNVAPSNAVLVARNASWGGRELITLKWGLVPSWSKEPKTEFSTLNARAETVAEKPTFRSAFRHRRCLIAADGFYEWGGREGRKQPYYIRLASKSPFAFAGIWEHWERAGESLDSCSILVTGANEILRSIHDRMPVIFSPASYDLWLDPAVRDPAKLKHLLVPYPAFLMAMHAVSARVNNVRNNDPTLISPLT